jgi:hopanoid biosynthesis associated protein HpnK
VIQLIINADDFGSSRGVNSAVIQAHQHGVLTSTSLMVGGRATDEAVVLARANPNLSVGLHLVMVDGMATLPHKNIPHLVDEEGSFPADPAVIGLQLVMNRAARQELAQELAAQFERFADTGLPLSHVDSHMHFHVHPVVLNLIIPLAQQYGAKGFRLPHDDLSLALSYDRQRAAQKVGWAFVFGIFQRLYKRRLRASELVIPKRVYGLMQSGDMNETYVVKLLQNIDVNLAELYFHPDANPATQILGPNPGDLTTLLSPKVRQAIESQNITLTNYANLDGRS